MNLHTGILVHAIYAMGYRPNMPLSLMWEWSGSKSFDVVAGSTQATPYQYYALPLGTLCKTTSCLLVFQTLHESSNFCIDYAVAR